MVSQVFEDSEGFLLKGETPKVLGLECDVTSETSVEKAFTRTIETFGRVDVAVAAAGELPSLFLSRQAVLSGQQEFSIITLRLSEPLSCVLYIFTRTELTPRYPTDRMKQLYDVNVHGVFYTAREAAKYMIPQGGGSIVLVASISADVSVIFLNTYPPS